MLDTHIVLWLDSGDGRLRPPTRALIDGRWRDGGTIFLSAITAWEIALLVDTGRIGLDIPVEAWIERFLGRPGIEGRRSRIAPPRAVTGCIILSIAIRRTGS